MIEIYTDGAVHFKRVSWGFVVLENNVFIYESCGELKGEHELLAQRNVAGEITAVMKALMWVNREIKKGMKIKEVLIVHDYSGCSAWPNGRWKAKNKYTQDYAKYVNKCRQQYKVDFKLIKGHGKNKNDKDNEWNDKADFLAKAALK